MLNPSELTWGVIQAAPGHELQAYASAAALGLMCYFPRYEASVACGGPLGTKRKVWKALFPAYLFFGEIPGLDRWKHLFRAEGVVRPLMSASEQLKTVPYEMVAQFRGAEADRVNGIKIAASWSFKVGDHIRVSEGQFSGLYGELTELDDDGRITFLLDILGRKVPIGGMHASQIEAM